MDQTVEKFVGLVFGEATTTDGQMIRFECRPEDLETVKAAFALARQVHMPVTRDVKKVSHGGYAAYSRFDVVQHKYAGSPGGYMEVLEIKDPPGGRCGYVVNEYVCGEAGSRTGFTNFSSLAEAVAAYDAGWYFTWEQGGRRWEKRPGYVGVVDCFGLQPWFYAVADQAIIGNCVAPDHSIAHPVFQPFKQYLVYPASDLPQVATLLAIYRQTVSRRQHSWKEKEEYVELVLIFDHGVTVRFDETDHDPPVVPLLAGSFWITQAMRKFQTLLAGKSAAFEIPFADGGKVKVKYHQPKTGAASRSGMYKLKVKLDGPDRKETIETEGEFKPTTECATVEQWLNQQAQAKGLTAQILSCVRVGSCKYRTYDGKRWVGVYPNPFSSK